MDLNQLRCAVAVADHRSFTRAAAALYLAQPTLSYTIAKLESELGVLLFLRRPREVTPTPAAMPLLVKARQMLALADEIRTSSNELGSGLAGELQIAAHSNAVSWLTEQLRVFRVAHPQVMITILDVEDGRDAVQLVKQGRADISLVTLGGVPVELPTVPVCEFEIVCVMPAHTAPEGPSVSLAELAQFPVIAPTPGTAIRDIYDAMFFSAGLTPRVVAQCLRVEWGIELARAGIGCAFTDTERVARARLDGVSVRSIAPAVTAELTLLHAPEMKSPAAAEFLDQVAPGSAYRLLGHQR